MTIYLRLLDKLPSFAYSKTIPIFMDDPNNFVGECTISRDKNGHHLGQLDLKHNIPEEYFMYYNNTAIEVPVFYLTSLLFLAAQQYDKPTPTLRECLVK